jgi:hypothetical protein
MTAVIAAVVEAAAGRFGVHRDVACFLDEANAQNRKDRREPGAFVGGCTIKTAARQLGGKETLACVVELSVQRAGESSWGGMGADGGVPSAHSMALVKHEGVLYVFDPQHREGKPRKSKVSPRGLRELLAMFKRVRYRSGDLPEKDNKCREGVVAFVERLAAGMDAELAGFEEMAR